MYSHMSRTERLEAARRGVLKRAEGTIGTAEAARRIGITPGAVRARIRRGRLLAFRSTRGTWQLPRAQFDGDATIDGLEAVLAAMYVTERWMRVQLFVDDDVLGALRAGRIEDAILAAESYLPYYRSSQAIA
jgi:hypothetical protein